jgi:hypothetical protein
VQRLQLLTPPPRRATPAVIAAEKYFDGRAPTGRLMAERRIGICANRKQKR